LLDSADCSAQAQREIVAQLDGLERDHEFLIIDTGAGIHRSVRQFIAAAQTAIIVTTPEPTAIADAYATLKALTGGSDLLQPFILVNQADSPDQAREIIARVQQTARTFLHLTVTSAGHIPRDPAVPAAVARRKPLLAENCSTPAGLAIEQLARRVVNMSQPASDHVSFFSQFAAFVGARAA
jgi:flagellar biosynthesis protein FlhG